jgi:large conductance mechanosensitive channel
MKNQEARSLLGEKELKEYRNFAFKDDMFKLAVGVVLGNSFNKVVYGISDYIVMPIFTFLASHTGKEWRQWNISPMKDLNFEIGKMFGLFVDFILISFILYLIYVKLLSKIAVATQPKIKPCPKCCGTIPACATKCPLCTGDLIVKARRTRRKNKRTANDRGE